MIYIFIIIKVRSFGGQFFASKNITLYLVLRLYSPSRNKQCRFDLISCNCYCVYTFYDFCVQNWLNLDMMMPL